MGWLQLESPAKEKTSKASRHFKGSNCTRSQAALPSLVPLSLFLIFSSCPRSDRDPCECSRSSSSSSSRAKCNWRRVTVSRATHKLRKREKLGILFSTWQHSLRGPLEARECPGRHCHPHQHGRGRDQHRQPHFKASRWWASQPDRHSHTCLLYIPTHLSNIQSMPYEMCS